MTDGDSSELRSQEVGPLLVSCRNLWLLLEERWRVEELSEYQR